MEISEAFGVMLILIGLAAPIIIIGVIYYLKKRLEHKQIMAAIEKGTPLSELRPLKQTGPTWIKSLTAGIALLIFAAGVAFVTIVGHVRLDQQRVVYSLFSPFSFVLVILLAVGISCLIRGLLLRKAQRQIQPPDKISAGEDKSRDIGG